MKGGRRQGRQRKRWEDNIRKWIGLEFGKSQRAVENCEIICGNPTTFVVKEQMMMMMMILSNFNYSLQIGDSVVA